MQIKHYNMPELRAEEKFEDFLRRTSDYQYLKANKLRREREIDASRTGGGLMGLALAPSAPLRVACIELWVNCIYTLAGNASTVQKYLD